MTASINYYPRRQARKEFDMILSASKAGAKFAFTVGTLGAADWLSKIPTIWGAIGAFLALCATLLTVVSLAQDVLKKHRQAKQDEEDRMWTLHNRHHGDSDVGERLP